MGGIDWSAYEYRFCWEFVSAFKGLPSFFSFGLEQSVLDNQVKVSLNFYFRVSFLSFLPSWGSYSWPSQAALPSVQQMAIEDWFESQWWKQDSTWWPQNSGRAKDMKLKKRYPFNWSERDASSQACTICNQIIATIFDMDWILKTGAFTNHTMSGF